MFSLVLAQIHLHELYKKNKNSQAHFTNDLNLAQRPCIARGNKVFRYSHDHTGISTF